MKQILVVCLLLVVVNADATFEILFPWLKPPKPPLFLPKFPLPGLPHHIPPGHQKSTPCPSLPFNVDNQLNDIKSCTAAWVCPDPKTGKLVITKINDTQSMMNENLHQDKLPKNETGKNNVNITKKALGTTPIPTEAPRNPGGEGLIDVRIGAN